MLHLLRMISWCEACPVLASALLSGLTGLGLMGASAWLITKASFSPPLYTLTLGITCVRACGLTRAVFRYLERYLSHRLAFRAYGQLQQRVYARAEAALPLLSGQTAQSDWLQRLITGCAMLRDSLVRALLPPAVTALLTLAVCCALPSPPAACLLALLYLAHFLCWPLLPAKADQAAAAYRAELLELLAGREELITAGSSALCCWRLDRAAGIYQAEDAKAEQRLDRLEAALALLRAIGLSLLLAILCAAARAGRLDGIELAVWLLLLLTLLQEYAGLLPALLQLRQTGPAMAGIGLKTVPPSENHPGKYIHAPGEQPLPPHHRKQTRSDEDPGTGKTVATPEGCLLEVTALSFAYPGHAPLFRELSFRVSPGRHTAIIGESGSGKTTLAYLLTGLYAPQAGEIRLRGQLPDGPRPEQLAACLQGCYVFSPSVRDNFLRLYHHMEEAEMLRCLDCARFLPVLENLPGGLDGPLGADAARLSGGERLRLLTALALASPAPLLLLDEPTAGLDKKTASALLAALFNRADERGQTLLIITHDLPRSDRFAQIIKL